MVIEIIKKLLDHNNIKYSIPNIFQDPFLAGVITKEEILLGPYKSIIESHDGIIVLSRNPHSPYERQDTIIDPYKKDFVETLERFIAEKEPFR